MKNIMIGVILPTRGLVFTEVEEAITRELSGFDYKVYRSHDLKIPDSQNYLVDQALKEECEYLLFVEEDTVMPEDAFFNLVKADSDIACVDYAVSGWSCVTKDKKGQVLWCGLGCTLVKREVFEKLEKPYFRSDKALLLNDWPEQKWIDAGEQAYGGQDIYFCVKARAKGFKIKQVPGECKHLKLGDLGKPEINRGLHNIIQKDTISKYQTL